MKKIGLICLAVVLTLGIGGVGFGWWSETLDIGQNQVDTGNFIVTFCDGGGADGWTSPTTGETVHLRGVISNDDAISDHAIWCNGPLLDPMVPDPDDDGSDPTVTQPMGQPIVRTDDVASTAVSGDGTVTMTVTIENAYPSYFPTVFFSIRNWGTIPAKVKSIKVIEVSVNGSTTAVDIPLVVCQPVYLDCDGDNDNDLMLHLSDDEVRLYQVMEAGSGVYGEHGYFESAVCGDLEIHVEDGAEELITYDFTVEIVAVPFNG